MACTRGRAWPLYIVIYCYTQYITKKIYSSSKSTGDVSLLLPSKLFRLTVVRGKLFPREMSETRNSTSEEFVVVCMCLPALYSFRVRTAFPLTFMAFRSTPHWTQQTWFIQSCAPCCCLYPVKILVKHREIRPAVSFHQLAPYEQQCLGQTDCTGLNLRVIIFCHIHGSMKINDEIALYIYSTAILSTLASSRYDNKQDKFGSNLLKVLVFIIRNRRKKNQPFQNIVIIFITHDLNMKSKIGLSWCVCLLLES